MLASAARENVIMYKASQDAEQLLDTVTRGIERASENGEHRLKVDVFMDHKENIDTVVQVLKARGYQTSKVGNALEVEW